MQVPMTIWLMDFSTALLKLQIGCKVSRLAWGSNPAWVRIDRYGIFDQGILVKCYASGEEVTWIPISPDLLASDWFNLETLKEIL